MKKNFWKIAIIVAILIIVSTFHPVQELFGIRATSLSAQVRHMQNMLNIKSENNQNTFLIMEESRGVEYFSLHKPPFGTVVTVCTIAENNLKVLYFESTGKHKYVGGFTLDNAELISIPRTRKINIYWLETPEEQSVEPIPSTVLLLVDDNDRGLGTSGSIQKGQKEVKYAEIRKKPSGVYAFNEGASKTDLALVLRR